VPAVAEAGSATAVVVVVVAMLASPAEAAARERRLRAEAARVALRAEAAARADAALRVWAAAAGWASADADGAAVLEAEPPTASKERSDERVRGATVDPMRASMPGREEAAPCADAAAPRQSIGRPRSQRKRGG